MPGNPLVTYTENAAGVAMKNADGDEVVDRLDLFEPRVELDERLGPEAAASILVVDLVPDVRGLDGCARACEALIVADELCSKIKNIHGYLFRNGMRATGIGSRWRNLDERVAQGAMAIPN